MIYMAIRGKSHPQEYPGILRYVEIVKNLFAQHCDGISYDRRFRMMRADNPNMPWSCYMAELVVRKPSQNPQDNPRPRSNTPTIPPPSSTPGSPNNLESLTIVIFLTLGNVHVLFVNTLICAVFVEKELMAKRPVPKKQEVDHCHQC